MSEESVVKLLVSIATPSYVYPWISPKRDNGWGTGFYINYNGKKYIMTNAHVIHNAHKIFARKVGDANNYKMDVYFTIYECDLSILTCDDKSFWNGMVPFKFGNMPNKSDAVSVLGYPLEGVNVNITRGIISRLTTVIYFGIVRGTALQIDAAINPGNSGGPAINNNNEVVGVVFLKRDRAENFNYIIPVAMCRFFLSALDAGYKQAPKRLAYLGALIQQEDDGAMISHITTGSSAFGILEKFDIIKSINNVPVLSDGSILCSAIYPGLTSKELIPFGNYISMLLIGENIKVKIIRNKKETTLNIALKEIPMPIPMLDCYIKPMYYNLLGIIFIPLSIPYLLERKTDIFAPLLKAHKMTLIIDQLIETNHVNISLPPLPSAIKTVNNTAFSSLIDLYNYIQTQTKLVIEFEDNEHITIITNKILKLQKKAVADTNIPEKVGF